MKTHNMSFFGQKTGAIFNSANRHEDFFFVRFIRKKQDGSWEKPSQGQGKSIKFNLGEMVQIMDIFSKSTPEWSTVHKYQGDSTSISFKGQKNAVQIFVSNCSGPSYSKYLKYPETKIFLDLLSHVYEEKIQFATGRGRAQTFSKGYEKNESLSSKKTDRSNRELSTAKMPQKNTVSISKSCRIKRDASSHNETPSQSSNDFQNPSIPSDPVSQKTQIYDAKSAKKFYYINPLDWAGSLQNDGEYSLVPGEILAKRGKAVSFQVNGLNSIWLPVSQVKDPDLVDAIGGLWTKNWILEKKLEDIFTQA